MCVKNHIIRVGLRRNHNHDIYPWVAVLLSHLILII